MSNIIEQLDAAYAAGFIKAAMDNGATPDQAVTILKKYAEGEGSSWGGRYLAQHAVPSAAQTDYPWRLTAMSLPFSTMIHPELLGGALPAVGASIAAAPVVEMLRARAMGGAGEGLKEKYEKAVRRVEGDSTMKNMARTAGKWALPGALAGGLGGVILSDAVSGVLPGDTWQIGGAGALGGLLGGTLGGGLNGLLQSAILKNTTPETKRRAIAMKSKHPYATALPFGDMIGAGYA